MGHLSIELISILSLVVMAVGLAVWRGRFAIGLQIIFFIRCQLLLGLSPIVLALLSWKVPTVLGNLVNLEQIHEGFLVALITFGAAWYALAITGLVLNHAGARFRVGKTISSTDGVERFNQFKAPLWFSKWSLTLFTIPPLILMARVAYASKGRVTRVTMGIVLGFMVASVIALIVDGTTVLFEPIEGGPSRFIFMSSVYPGRIGSLLRTSDPIRKCHIRWLRYFGPGYADEDGRPYADQITAVVAFFLTIVLYTLSFWWGWSRLQHGHGGTAIPALAYLEFLVTVVAVILAAASFFLDRYRMSLVLAVVIYTMVVSHFIDTDHYWRAIRPTDAEMSSGSVVPVKAEDKQAGPGDYTDGVDAWLRKYQKAGSILRVKGAPVVVVVCASGGGIQATAWTAKVLTGLQSELGEMGKPFSRSIRLISSTSGGSVASLFFVQSFFSAKDAPDDDQLQRINEAATQRSLDATGWGIANPDFARLFAPWILPIWLRLGPGADAQYVDRGWALEQSWSVALKDPKNSAKYINSTLSNWRVLVNEGVLPGTVFNSTLVESGAPILFSSVRVPLPDGQMEVGSRSLEPPHPPQAWLFGQRSSDFGADISNVTAARLSATFPYVSPVARGCYGGACSGSTLPAKGQHLADGGYYDNYGFTVAAEWINDIFHRYGPPSGKNRLGKIIIILIDAFPENHDQAPELNPDGGWSAEVLGPIKTIVDARSETQLGRDEIEAALLDNLNSGISDSSNIACPKFISIIRFTSPKGGPLSWQLSADDKDNINKDWRSATIRDQIRNLELCLGLPADGHATLAMRSRSIGHHLGARF